MNDTKLWNKFCNLYDTKYLDQLSRNAKQLLINIIRKKANKIKFKGLYQIINNHISLVTQTYTPKIYDKLTDVLSLSYYTSSKYNKRIYIFGEDHYPDNKCSIILDPFGPIGPDYYRELLRKKQSTTVYNFIVENITHSDKFIDFFLELPYVEKKYLKSKEIIQSTTAKTIGGFEKQFYNCFYKKEKCQYPNIRFHYTDIRSVKPPDSPFIILLDRYINDLYYTVHNNNYVDYIYYLNMLNWILTIPKYKNECDVLFHVNDHDELLEILLQTYDRFKFKYQQNKIIYPEIKKELIEYLYNKILKIDLNIIRSTKKIINSLPTDKLSTKENINKLVSTYLDLNISFIDIYLLSRVFRSFREVKYQNSREPKNIIIYAGELHALIYRNLLEKFNFKHEFSSYAKTNDFCIDIRKLKQPLFS